MSLEEKRKYLLSFDLGTSACKITLFNLMGRVIKSTVQEHKTYYPKKNWVEQNPDDWWEGICTGLKEIEIKSFSSNIIGIGIAGQSWACLPVDKNGQALRKVMIWLDRRSVEQAR